MSVIKARNIRPGDVGRLGTGHAVMFIVNASTRVAKPYATKYRRIVMLNGLGQLQNVADPVDPTFCYIVYARGEEP